MSYQLHIEKTPGCADDLSLQALVDLLSSAHRQVEALNRSAATARDPATTVELLNAAFDILCVREKRQVYDALADSDPFPPMGRICDGFLDHAIGLLKAGQYTAAVSFCSSALALKKTGRGHNNRGVALACLLELNQAHEDFERAITEDPEEPCAHSNLAKLGAISEQIRSSFQLIESNGASQLSLAHAAEPATHEAVPNRSPSSFLRRLAMIVGTGIGGAVGWFLGVAAVSTGSTNLGGTIGLFGAAVLCCIEVWIMSLVCDVTTK